jgi:hypothetical protein
MMAAVAGIKMDAHSATATSFRFLPSCMFPTTEANISTANAGIGQ